MSPLISIVLLTTFSCRLSRLLSLLALLVQKYLLYWYKSTCFFWLLSPVGLSRLLSLIALLLKKYLLYWYQSTCAYWYKSDCWPVVLSRWFWFLWRICLTHSSSGVSICTYVLVKRSLTSRSGQYLYFCTSKGVSICTFELVKTTSSCRPFSLVLISMAHLPQQVLLYQ